MGAVCAGSSKQRPTILKTQIDQPNITTGDLTFKVLLKNIKLTIPGVKQCQIEFDLGKSKYISPNHISIEFNHFWRASYETQLTMTEEQMKLTNVSINVLSPQSIGNTHINMFEVAVGPFHFDLPIKNQLKKLIGRVTFDLKMQQIISPTIECKYINCQMNSSISEVGYNYNIRLVTSTLSFVSEHSETYINPNYRRSDDKTPKSAYNSRKSLIDSQVSLSEQSPQFKNMQPAVQALHQLEWEHTDDGVGQIVELPVNEFTNSAVQVCVWSVQSMPKGQQGKSIRRSQKMKNKVYNYKHDSEYVDLEIQDHHLVAETYISLVHLQSQIEAEMGGDRFISLNCDQPKPLWFHGVEIGTISYTLNIKLPPHLSQTTFGMQTDQGIQQQVSVVGQLSLVSVVEVQQLQMEFQKLSSTVFRIEHKKSLMKEKVQARYEAAQSVAKLEQLLNQTHSELIKTFQYKSDEDLLKAQQLFVDIAEHLIEFSATLESIEQDKFYSCLNLVLERGELMLAQMGFFKALGNKLHNVKTNACLHYQSFLINTLKLVLDKINQKDPSKAARHFHVKFIVHAYFRIPQFRAKLLEQIIKPDDPPLTEARGTEFIQEEDAQNIDRSSKQNINIFDWQNHFHAYLQEQQKAIANQASLNSILDEEQWKENIRHRSTSFAFFVEEWAKYVRNLLQGKLLPWQDIPGYRTLTKALLCELKTQESITDAMRNALKSLLQNPNLLNVIVSLLYNKTNLFDAERAAETFDVLNMCLTTLQANNSSMPPYFDYTFFLKGIKSILNDSEHALSLAKCIWMLYNSYNQFSLDFKKDLCDYLFEKVVFKLFFHWSKTVRMIFHNFLAYRIYHQHRNPHLTNQNEEQIIQEYAVLTRPKKQQSYFENRHHQNQLISDYIYMKYFRFLGKVEQEKQTHLHKPFIAEPSTYYAKMLLKLKQHKGQEEQQELPQVKLMQTTDKLLIKDQRQNLVQQKLNDSVIEEEVAKKQLVVPRQIIHRKTNKHDADISEYQLPYITIAGKEYDELMKHYNNWRQSKMKATLSKTKLTDEEKTTIHLTFEIPKIDVLQRIDEKEGT